MSEVNPISTQTIARQIDIPRPVALFLIALLLLGATWIRSYKVTSVPAGYAFDATWDLADGLRISRGIPFPGYFETRSEPAHRWMIAASFVLLGTHVYSVEVLQIFIALLTISFTYTAGLALLAGQDWRRLGALIAAGVVAASVPNLFVSRIAYHAALVAPVVAFAAALLLRANRRIETSKDKQNKWVWFLGGFVGGMGVHTYQSGIVTPVWVVGFVIHRLIFGRPRRWSIVLWTALGMLPPLMIWFVFIKLVPDLFFRIHVAGGDTPFTVQRIIGGFFNSFREFFFTGYPLPIYNTPDTPFLNPVFSVLAVIGAVLAIRYWKRPEGSLLLGGVIIFILPASLSEDPLHPVRLIGTLPLLAMLVGWGGTWVANQASKIRISRTVLVATANSVIAVSMIFALLAYLGMFADPSRYDPPGFWYSVPHNYMIAHSEALEWLETVKEPTYVPRSILDTPAGYYIVQRSAFLTVTTWARHPLSELPAGQFFAPLYDYFQTAILMNSDPCTALLLPNEKTIVILPCSAANPLMPEPISPQTHMLKSPFGWDIARITPVVARPFVPPQFVASQSLTTIGQGLKLVGEEVPANVTPGQKVSIVLDWQVEKLQPTDIFSVVQLIDLNYGQHGSSDQWTLGYLFPSARWQIGDIIPDLHQITVPADLPTGIFRWGAGVYVPPSKSRLLIQPQDSDLNDLWMWSAVRNPLPAILTLPAATIDLTKQAIHFDDHIDLIGYSLEKTPTIWKLTLYWKADAPPKGDYTIFVHMQQNNQIVAQQDAKPDNGKLPTWAWSSNELITTSYTLNIPCNAKPDALYVGMYSYPSLQRLSVTQNSIPAVDNRVILPF